MAFESKVAHVKKELARDLHLFPVRHDSDGTNYICTSIRVPGGAVRYVHQWKYSPDGTSIKGEEVILDSGLSRMGLWTMSYFGRTMVDGLTNEDLCEIYDFRTRYWAENPRGDHPKNPILRGPLLRTACLCSEDDDFKPNTVSFDFEEFPDGFRGTEIVALDKFLAFQLDMEGKCQSR